MNDEYNVDENADVVAANVEPIAMGHTYHTI